MLKWKISEESMLLGEGHVMQMLEVVAYFHVVTRVTAYIALTMAAFHDQEIKTANVLNAYVYAQYRDKKWKVLDSEFDDDDKSTILVNVLNRLKSTDASFRAHLA